MVRFTDFLCQTPIFNQLFTIWRIKVSRSLFSTPCNNCESLCQLCWTIRNHQKNLRFFSKMVRSPRNRELCSEDGDGVEVWWLFPMLKQMVKYNVLDLWLQQLWKSKATTSTLIDPKIVHNIRFIVFCCYCGHILVEPRADVIVPWNCFNLFFTQHQKVFMKLNGGSYRARIISLLRGAFLSN